MFTVFCSNTKFCAWLPKNSLSSINNLLTFTLSKAEALVCKVFWPNTAIPVPGKEAIGLTLALYKESLSVLDNLLSAWITPTNPPLTSPAGANHGASAPSVNAYTPGINNEGGAHTFLPVADLVCNQGQYVAAYELFSVAVCAAALATVPSLYFLMSNTKIQSPLLSAREIIFPIVAVWPETESISPGDEITLNLKLVGI